MKNYLLAIIAMTLTVLTLPVSAKQSFQGLGDLPGGDFSSQAFAVSGDGSVIVGQGNSGGFVAEAFRWTQATSMVAMGDLPGGVFSSTAFGVSDDGLVIVGGGISASGQEAFRWTQATGMVGLGDLPGGSFASRARGVSGDGLVIVGHGGSIFGTVFDEEAMRWTLGTGMVGLGDLPGCPSRKLRTPVSTGTSVCLPPRLMSVAWMDVQAILRLSPVPTTPPLVSDS